MQASSSPYLHPSPAKILDCQPPTTMVRSVVLGDTVIQTWYSSIYPDENASDEKALETDLLFVCPSCMKYTMDGSRALAHMVSLSPKFTSLCFVVCCVSVRIQASRFLLCTLCTLTYQYPPLIVLGNCTALHLSRDSHVQSHFFTSLVEYTGAIECCRRNSIDHHANILTHSGSVSLPSALQVVYCTTTNNIAFMKLMATNTRYGSTNPDFVLTQCVLLFCSFFVRIYPSLQSSSSKPNRYATMLTLSFSISS